MLNIIITISRWSTVLADSLCSGPQPRTRLTKNVICIVKMDRNSFGILITVIRK
jgi:hypothetical protein